MRLSLLPALMAAYVGFAASPLAARWRIPCPFRQVVGFDCPLCGTTRTVKAFTSFRLPRLSEIPYGAAVVLGIGIAVSTSRLAGRGSLMSRKLTT